MGGQNQTNGTRGEPLFCSPDARWNMKPIERTVQQNGTLVPAVIQYDLERPTGCYDELVAFLVCVRAPGFSAWNIIAVENAFDIKRHIDVSVNRGDVPGPVLNAGKFDDGTIIYRG